MISWRAVGAALGRRPVMLVFVASIAGALAFNAVLPVSSQAERVPDYVRFYEPVGRAILDGRGPVQTDGLLALRYPPGYPVIVAGVLGTAQVLRLPEGIVMRAFVLLTFGVTSVLLFGLARLLWEPLPALITAAAWMTYPFALWLTRQPSSELPFMVVFLAALLLSTKAVTSKRVRPGRFLLGALAGFAMLIRPIAIGLGIILAFLVWFALRNRPAKIRYGAAAMIVAGNVVAVLPWEIQAYRSTGQVIPLSTAGVPALRDGLTFAVRENKGRAGIAVSADVRALMLNIDRRYGELASLGAVAAVMREQWRERPMAVVKLYLLKVARSWYGTDSQRYERPILFVQCFYLAALLWSARLARRRHGMHRAAVSGIAVLAGYFLVMNLAGLTLLRYSVPTLGLAMILLPACFLTRRSQAERVKVYADRIGD